jgi:aquaporin Z
VNLDQDVAKLISMRVYITELLGTFILIFCSTGAIIINQQTEGAIGHIGIAITTGLTVMTLIYAFGSISGAHFNPAVTISFTLAGKSPLKNLVPCIIAQLTGAIAASLALKILFPFSTYLGATIPSGSSIQSFVLELFLSFFLMLVIITVSHGSKEQGMFAGLAIGATVLLEAMFAGPISGASMNPVRSIAPALVSGHLEYLWIYVIATVTGALLAVPVWNYISKMKTENF